MRRQRPFGSDIPTPLLVLLTFIAWSNAFLRVWSLNSEPAYPGLNWALLIGMVLFALVLSWLIWRRLTGREPPRQDSD